MIGCTKLLCGTATVSEAMRHGRDSGKLPPHMLQFSTDARPVVFWNTTNRCNLSCKHCYISAEDRDYPNEMTTDESKSFLKDLGGMGVPVVMFSGGEPLVRKDLFDLGAYAVEAGLRPVISTNGTLITKEAAKKIKEVGFQYVGVSIDGGRETHDDFRAMDGAFDRAIQGIRNSVEAGVKAGMRLTVNKYNFKDLPEVLRIVEEEKIPRFCMYHLVYAGRGTDIVDMDLSKEERREVLDWLIAKTIELHKRGIEVEILTTDSHADGVYILNKIKEEEPERVDEVLQLLEMHGGCSAGHKAANVDPQGNIHPCQFWPHVTLGNVRQRSFSEIWNDMSNEFLKKLRFKHEHITGRCGDCKYNRVCGGCRIRAEYVHGDVWAEDPACYLTDEEIGLGEDSDVSHPKAAEATD